MDNMWLKFLGYLIPVAAIVITVLIVFIQGLIILIMNAYQFIKILYLCANMQNYNLIKCLLSIETLKNSF